MKRIMRIVSCLLALTLLCGTAAFALQSGADLPVSAEQAELKWTYRAGTDYKNAPTIPAYYDGKVYFMHADKLSCIDADNGKLLSECTLSGRNQYTQVPVLCTDKYVYCPMDGGKVQAVLRADMKADWVYTDPLGGQGLTPIVTDGTRLYTGFWNDEEADANFVCLDAQTGDRLWSVKRFGGYYRASCALSGGKVLLCGDDGSAKTGTGDLLCVDALSGEVLDTLSGIAGDFRAGFGSDGSNFYFATKAGILYKVSLSGDKLTLEKQLKLHGDCTTTPILYGGKAYVTAMSGRYKGEVLVLNASTLAIEKTVELRAYPQGEALLCTAEPLRLYTTYNSPPGGVQVVDLTAGTAADLFEPGEGMQNYSTSSVQVTSDGTLLFKNDSGVIIAVGKKAEKPLTLWQRFVLRIRQFFEKLFSVFKVGR